MHTVICPEAWPALQTPEMKPAQIRWNCEERFRYNLMVDQLPNWDH